LIVFFPPKACPTRADQPPAEKKSRKRDPFQSLTPLYE